MEFLIKKIFNNHYLNFGLQLLYKKKHKFLDGVFIKKKALSSFFKFLFSEFSFFSNYIIKLIETKFNTKFFMFRDSCSIASLFLIFFKIVFGNLFFVYNLFLFGIFFLISFYFSLNLIFKEFLAKLLNFMLGPYYTLDDVGIDDSWNDLKELNYPDIPKRNLFNRFSEYIIYFFILLRLHIFAEPFLCINFKMLFCYFLFFNHLHFFSYLISLLFIISRFIFFLNDDSYEQFKSLWKEMHPSFYYDPSIAIKPTLRNAKYIGAWIISGTNKKYRSTLSFKKDLWYKAKEKEDYSYIRHLWVILENLNHPSLFANCYNRNAFTCCKKNKNVKWFLKGILFFSVWVFFTSFFNDSCNLNTLNFDWYLISPIGKDYLKPLFQKIPKNAYWIHSFYGKIDENGRLHIAITTTMKPNFNNSLHFPIQIEPVTVIPRAIYSIKLDNPELFHEKYFVSSNDVAVNKLNSMKASDFIPRDINFLIALQEKQPNDLDPVMDFASMKTSPSFFLYSGFMDYVFAHDDIYDNKLLRKQAFEQIAYKLKSCKQEDEKTKLGLKQVELAYNDLEPKWKHINALWEKTVKHSKQTDTQKIQNVIEEFSKEKPTFVECAKAVNFNLFDGVPNKSLIVKKTHQSMANDIIRQEHAEAVKRRNAKKEDLLYQKEAKEKVDE